MVAIGGITRLTESGLSITEWKPVTGALPPMNEAAWQVEFEKYQQIPEYQLLNQGMDLAGFKRIFFWEWLHRNWGRLMGLVFMLPIRVLAVQYKVKYGLPVGDDLPQAHTLLIVPAAWQRQLRLA